MACIIRLKERAAELTIMLAGRATQSCLVAAVWRNQPQTKRLLWRAPWFPNAFSEHICDPNSFNLHHFHLWKAYDAYFKHIGLIVCACVEREVFLKWQDALNALNGFIVYGLWQKKGFICKDDQRERERENNTSGSVWPSAPREDTLSGSFSSDRNIWTQCINK